jgi:hypothetical protein
MDQTVLVKSDRDIGAKIINALSKVNFPITLWDWAYIPQLVEWQLVIASPWVNSKGPRTTYRAVVDALKKASIYDQAPMRRVFLRPRWHGCVCRNNRPLAAVATVAVSLGCLDQNMAKKRSGPLHAIGIWR